MPRRTAAAAALGDARAAKVPMLTDDAAAAEAAARPARWFVALHLGAGFHRAALAVEYRALADAAIDRAVRALREGGDAVQAAVECVALLEDAPSTNAGFGSSLTRDGRVECDALVTDGPRSGAVGAISGVRNPVRAAALVLESQRNELVSPCVSARLMVGDGAAQFVRQQRPSWCCEPASLESPLARRAWRAMQQANEPFAGVIERARAQWLARVDELATRIDAAADALRGSSDSGDDKAASNGAADGSDSEAAALPPTAVLAAAAAGAGGLTDGDHGLARSDSDDDAGSGAATPLNLRRVSASTASCASSPPLLAGAQPRPPPPPPTPPSSSSSPPPPPPPPQQRLSHVQSQPAPSSASAAATVGSGARVDDDPSAFAITDLHLLHDTVGCIVIDGEGRLATASSSGGIPYKMPGRVGHAALYGCVAAYDSLRASGDGDTTGHDRVRFGCVTSGLGEVLMMTCAAHDCVARMRAADHATCDPTAVARNTLDVVLTHCSDDERFRMVGLLAVSTVGDSVRWGISHSTPSMCVAVRSSGAPETSFVLSRSASTKEPVDFGACAPL